MDLRRDLLARIDAYLAATGMAATTFGRLALHDGNFVRRLRSGRGLTARTHARLEAFMRDAPASGRPSGVRPSPDLARTIRILRSHRTKLEAEGIAHIAVFGSVARGEAHAASDVDVLIEVSPSHRMGLFRLAHLKRQLADLVPNADVVDKSSLHFSIAERVAADAVYAF